MRTQSIFLASGIVALGMVLLGGTASDGWAQDIAAAASDEADEVLVAEELGISLSRIQHRLDRLPDEADARRMLRLSSYVQVYGRASRLDLFNGFDVTNAPIPYGVPMHNEMLRAMRPNDHFPDVVNLNPVLGWTWRALRP